jgi:hypothetical protein
MSYIVRLLTLLTAQLDVLPRISRKSAQTIPYAWSTWPEAKPLEHMIGTLACAPDCPWPKKLTRFCGMSLVHQNQEACPRCGAPVRHVPETLPLVDRLMRVTRSLDPRGELVPFTQRSRAVVELDAGLTIQVGQEIHLLMGRRVGDETVSEPHDLARIILILGNAVVQVHSPRRTPVNVVWSNGVVVQRDDARVRQFASEAQLGIEPVIFSTSGPRAIITVSRHDPNLPLILYEIVTITGPGTTLTPPIELFPELRRLEDHELPPPPPSLQSLVMAQQGPRASPGLMHSSNSFKQHHGLILYPMGEARFVLTLARDPVLVFFRERTLWAYTGTNVYRLVTRISRRAGALLCHSLREPALDSHHTVTLAELVTMYGVLQPWVTIEMLLLIQLKRGAPLVGFGWQCVPIDHGPYQGPAA